jgi:hypothetical protein
MQARRQAEHRFVEAPCALLVTHVEDEKRLHGRAFWRHGRAAGVERRGGQALLDHGVAVGAVRDAATQMRSCRSQSGRPPSMALGRLEARCGSGPWSEARPTKPPGLEGVGALQTGGGEMNATVEQALLTKIKALSPQQVAEVVDFVEFLSAKASRRAAFDRLLAIAPALEAAGAESLSEEETVAEIKAARAERRARLAAAPASDEGADRS